MHNIIVDFAYLRHRTNDFLKAIGRTSAKYHSIDWPRFFASQLHPREDRRVIVYDAIDKGSVQEKECIESISRSDFIQCRSTHLRKNGNERKQKGIDILIAMDALKFAENPRCSAITFFAGDIDFVPLFERLRDLQISVGLVNFGNPADELLHVCDTSEKISITAICNFPNLDEAPDLNFPKIMRIKNLPEDLRDTAGPVFSYSRDRQTGQFRKKLSDDSDIVISSQSIAELRDDHKNFSSAYSTMRAYF